MAGAWTEADTSWKEKYEKSEKSLTNLKSLAHKAVADYEDLLRKYDQNQKQYEELKQRLVDTEKQLADLQNVLEPVYDEYNELDLRYKIEKGCRNQAEHYATKVVQENKKLKRQSQMLVQSLSSVDVDITKLAALEKEAEEAAENGSTSSVDQTEHFNNMIEDLQGQVVQLQHKLTKAEAERDASTEALRNTQAQHEADRVVMARLQSSLEYHEAQLGQFKRVSQSAYNEYGDLIERFLNERKLREEAEKFASKMKSERDAMAKESSVLIGSAMSDDRLRGSLLQIEDLNKSLELERTEHKQQMEALEEQLKASESPDLENKLGAATDQIELLQKQLTEARTWWEKMESRNRELENKLDTASQKLDVAEQRLKPPPPPPLPPTGFLKPFKNFLIKKPKKTAAKENDEKNKPYEDALHEMMGRIKGGVTLRPVARRKRTSEDFMRSDDFSRHGRLRPSLPEMSPDIEDGQAMQDLQKMLVTMKTRSRSVPAAIDSTRQNNELSELQATFMRIKAKTATQTDQSWHAGEPPNRNLSLIEEVEEKESLSPRPSSSDL